MPNLSVKWIFELDGDWTYNIRSYLPASFTEGCAFEDRYGKRWLEILPNGDARVLAPYAWDGCTPKFSTWDIAFGIPDGIPHPRTRKPKAYYASLMHDVLYQFLEMDLPVTRRDADCIFLDLLARDDFGPRRIYFLAVRLFGGGFHIFTRWKRRYRGRRVPL